MQTPQLSDIYIYPVKSLTGIRVEHWPVNEKGLLYDRHWMLIDDERRFLSQRRLPQMTLIKVALSDTHLTLTTPGMSDLTLGLDEQTGETLPVEIWKDVCTANLVSVTADRWFSQFLKSPCRLVFQAQHDRRRVDPLYAEPHDQTGFSDGFPFLIIAENSLTSLNKHLAAPTTMAQFRPNLVITHCDAYAEDSWREISINDIHFRLPKPCSRCVVPTVDLQTGEYGKEPLHTLNRLRKVNNKVYFGQNALHNQTGILRCHAGVTVLSSGAKQPALN